MMCHVVDVAIRCKVEGMEEVRRRGKNDQYSNNDESPREGKVPPRTVKRILKR